MIINLFRTSQKFVLLFILNIINRTTNPFIFLLLTRLRTSNEASLFLLAVSYSLIVQALSFWSLDQLLIKDVTENLLDTKKSFPIYVGLRLTLSFIGLLLFCIFINSFTKYSQDTTKIIIIIVSSIILDGYNDISLALFIAINDLHRILFINIIITIIKLIIIIVMIVNQKSILYISFCIFAITFINVISNMILISMKNISVIPNFNKYALMLKAHRSLPLALINLLWVVDAQCGNLFISIVSDSYNVSFYGVASTIITSLVIIPQTLQTILFPLILEAHSTSTKAIIVLHNKLVFYLTIVASIIVLILLSSAEQLIRIFNEKYTDSLYPLFILSFTLFFYFLNIPNSRILIIRDKIWHLAYFLFISLIINWTLLYFLFPIISINAVALSRLCSILCFFLLNYFYIYKNIYRISIIKSIWQPIVSFVISGFMIFVIPDIIWFFKIILTIAIFIIVVAILNILPNIHTIRKV